MRALDLHAINGTAYDWCSADCRRICLCGSRLRHTDLAGVWLDQADLSFADLSDTDLSHAYLRDADLRSARLTRAKLVRANLTGADLAGATLAQVDLSWANLSGAPLETAVWTGAYFFGSAVATMLGAGVTPCALLDERAAASRRELRALHFSASTGNRCATLRHP